MPSRVYGLNERDRKLVDDLLRKGPGGGRRSRRPVPTRRRNRSASSTGTMLLVQVNEEGHVFYDDEEFSFDNVTVFWGRNPQELVTDEGEPVEDEGEPVYETGGTAVNFWQEMLLDDEWLWLAFDRAEDRWVPDRPGTTLRHGVVTSTISAATGYGDGDRGTGSVQFKHRVTGANVGAPKTVTNPFFDAFPVGAVGQFDTTGGPPMVVSIGCTLAS